MFFLLEALKVFLGEDIVSGELLQLWFFGWVFLRTCQPLLGQVT